MVPGWRTASPARPCILESHFRSVPTFYCRRLSTNGVDPLAQLFHPNPRVGTKRKLPSHDVTLSQLCKRKSVRSEHGRA